MLRSKRGKKGKMNIDKLYFFHVLIGYFSSYSSINSYTGFLRLNKYYHELIQTRLFLSLFLAMRMLTLPCSPF